MEANETLREQQKTEALERMKMLHIMGNVCNALRKSNRIFYSERQGAIFDGILYYLDSNKQFLEIVKNFEEQNNALVYHCQLCHTSIGDMLTLLFVSCDPNDWKTDKDMLERGEAIAFVYNLSDPYLSELGLVGVAPRNGGITRTY